LIIPDSVGGVFVCACGRVHPTPFFCCFVCYTGVVGWVCCNKGRWGLCGGYVVSLM